MFYVKQTDAKELVKRVLACQQNEKKREELITAEGLRVEPVPSVDAHKIRWTPSGLINPNAWRDK